MRSWAGSISTTTPPKRMRYTNACGNREKLENAEDIAAATCLYTERYMVDYLLQNTLGTMWVEMYPETRLRKQWAYYVIPPDGNPEGRA